MSISVAPKKISINMQDQFQIKAERLANKFSSISDFAEQLAFPDYHKGIFAQKDLRKLRSTEKYLYNFTYPFTTPDKLGIKFFGLVCFNSFYICYFRYRHDIFIPSSIQCPALIIPPKRYSISNIHCSGALLCNLCHNYFILLVDRDFARP